MLPLYFKLIDAVPALEILAHRVVWSLLLLAALVTLLGRWRSIAAALADRRTIALLAASAMLIATNWLIYIWAVQNDHVLEASLGYFINPLVNVALGVAVLGERLRRTQAIAVGIAAVGVAAMALSGGGLILISLGLALSFGLYGLARKVAPVDPLGGLLIETGLLGPLALGWLAWTAAQGTLMFGAQAGGAGLDALLLLSCVITAAPLLLFAAAAKRMDYATLGLFQYIAPTLQFLQAVLLFGEPMRPIHFLTFGCIWGGLALYAWDSLRGGRSMPVAPPE